MQLSKKMKNISGQTFGSLTALRPVHLNNFGVVVWEWSCKCGKLHQATGTQIRAVQKNAVNPNVPSCGCVCSQRATETGTTHGYSRHPLNDVWQQMKQRCYNPDHKEYCRYGAKGVTVCDEWLDSLENFINWALSAGWKKGMHLDKDTLSDSQNTQRKYSPTSCTFLTGKANVAYSASRTNHLNNSKIKLIPSIVVEIKKLYASGECDQRQIASQYDVSQASVWRAIHS